MRKIKVDLRKEFDGINNNKNKDTNTRGIYEHDVDDDSKEDEDLKDYNNEA